MNRATQTARSIHPGARRKERARPTPPHLTPPPPPRHLPRGTNGSASQEARKVRGAEGRRPLPQVTPCDPGRGRLGATARVMGLDGARDRHDSESRRDVLEEEPRPSSWSLQRRLERGRLSSPGKVARQVSSFQSSTTSVSFFPSRGTVNYSWREHAENISPPPSFPTWASP